MTQNQQIKNGPLVSVLLSTYNRRRYLPVSLSSVLRQNYDNLEILVIRDGGQAVSDIVNSFNDSRIVFIDRDVNRGLPFSLNQALALARGKYICYLGDDDLYYPGHVGSLVNALENKTDCGVAYSDLYKTYCRIMPDGSRQVLSKVVEISRDFDRFFTLYFNHTLHVSLMHRRDLLEKTGLYNEDLNVMIDWDMTRRLVFFTDFYHVPEITGEFYAPVDESDRISYQQRKDNANYVRNVLAIRTTRPPKPWPKVKDLSIIFTSDSFDQQAGTTIGLVWRHTFYPYKLYLPLPSADVNRINTEMPNIVYVPVPCGAAQTQQVDAALSQCEGEYIVIVPSGFPVEEMWVEDPLFGLLNSNTPKEAIELEASTDEHFAVVLRKNDIQNAGAAFKQPVLRQSLDAAGISVRKLRPEEVPFQFDSLYKETQDCEKNGNFLQAAKIYKYIAANYKNQLWMNALAAKALWKAGFHQNAIELASAINNQRPSIDTLLLEAKVKREKKDFSSAIELLEKAEGILEGSCPI